LKKTTDQLGSKSNQNKSLASQIALLKNSIALKKMRTEHLKDATQVLSNFSEQNKENTNKT
jgi:hypothetical protein